MAVYSLIVRNKHVCTAAESFDEYIDALDEHLDMLLKWRTAGVKLDTEGLDDDYARFFTEDPEVAKIFGFMLDDEELDV